MTQVFVDTGGFYAALHRKLSCCCTNYYSLRMERR